MTNDSARRGFCPVCGGHEFVNGRVHASGLQFVATSESLQSAFDEAAIVEGRVCRACGHLQVFVSLLASRDAREESVLDEATGEPPLSEFLSPDELAEEKLEEPLSGEELVRRAQRPWLL